jgi:hypothetical protein
MVRGGCSGGKLSKVELRAAFDAWAHAEAGLTFQDLASYTQQELVRLQLGWLIREQPDAEQGPSGMGGRRAEFRRRHRERREEVFGDLGIH